MSRGETWGKEKPTELWENSKTIYTSPPMTSSESLMESLPCGTPSDSNEELLPLREAIANAIDLLDGRSRYCFEMTQIGKETFADVARYLGISNTRVHQIVSEAKRRLSVRLSTEPLVVEHLNQGRLKNWTRVVTEEGTSYVRRYPPRNRRKGGSRPLRVDRKGASPAN
jgi:hypothetical protein